MKKLLLTAIMISALNAEGISGLFSQGQKNFGFGVGSSSGYGSDYTVVNASLNYFVQNNISMGVGYQGWFGGDPKINQISIPVTYYHPLSAQYHPYIGATYSHTFIEEPYEDYDVIAGRVGIAMTMGANTYVTIGWVQEHRTKGDESSDDGYPQVSMGFVF